MIQVIQVQNVFQNSLGDGGHIVSYITTFWTTSVLKNQDEQYTLSPYLVAQSHRIIHRCVITQVYSIAVANFAEIKN